jgi:FkbM family methyltransferase
MIVRKLQKIKRNTHLAMLTLPQLVRATGVERLGTKHNRWSVCTPMINDKSVIYSFGIGTDVSFDLGLMERFGVTVHAFDPTPASVAWVTEHHSRPDLIVHPYGLAHFNGFKKFYPPDNPNHISHTLVPKTSPSARAFDAEFKTLDTVMNELNHNRIDVLKMDIEGAEYEVVEDILRKKLFPRQWLIEYHHEMYPGLTTRQTLDSVKKLMKSGYKLFHVSRTLREFHFIRP